jgi:two-component system, cell cycle sensor histidine kinase PleC
MLLVPQRPTCGPLDQERASRAVPAFIVDALAGALLGANPAGWEVWGLDPALAKPPVGIDRAMPALQRLRQLADELRSGNEETLTFWTARGLARLDCRTEALPGGAATFAVHVLGDVAAANDGQRGVQPQNVALTAWLAHELRTPLSAVIACAEILKSEHFGPLTNVRYRGYAGAIYDSARHALGVVDGVLHGDPARAGVPAMAFADIDPADVVESCLTVARPLAEKAGLELSSEFAPWLPHIVADEVSLRQMLLNLLGNAIKFTRPGDKVSVAISYQADGPLTIAVADTGPGIQPARDTADGEQAPNRAAGLGLGLPLTKALAAANGAELAIESEPGQGTRVTITFGKDRIVPV